jgi:hypothetical protein
MDLISGRFKHSINLPTFPILKCNSNRPPNHVRSFLDSKAGIKPDEAIHVKDLLPKIGPLKSSFSGHMHSSHFPIHA